MFSLSIEKKLNNRIAEPFWKTTNLAFEKKSVFGWKKQKKSYVDEDYKNNWRMTGLTCRLLWFLFKKKTINNSYYTLKDGVKLKILYIKRKIMNGNLP